MSQQAGPGFVGRCLSKFVAASRWDMLPRFVRHEGKRSLLNFIGCALGVARTPPIEMAMRVLTLTVRGRTRHRARPHRAARSAGRGVRQRHRRKPARLRRHASADGHPSDGAGRPAALALAEQRGLSGAAMLHAFILGAEVECRIGNAVSPGHYARGWHITSTCGVFGSAAASAKLLGLDAAADLACAGHRRQPVGRTGREPAQCGEERRCRQRCAQRAVRRAAGRTGLHGGAGRDRGRARLGACDGRRSGGCRGDRRSWRALGDAKNTYKPYPCGIVMHAVIDACLALRRDHAVTPAEIAEIIVSGDQLLLDRGDRTVSNDRDARVSIHHCAAVSLLFGAAGLKEFSDEIVHDPAVVALRGLDEGAVERRQPPRCGDREGSHRRWSDSGVDCPPCDGQHGATALRPGHRGEGARSRSAWRLSRTDRRGYCGGVATRYDGNDRSVDRGVASTATRKRGQRERNTRERTSMKAMLLTGHGGPETLRYGDVADPAAGRR